MTFHDLGTSWFLAQLKPNCTNIADQNRKRQGFQTFLPMEEETRQRGGKFVTAMRPPGYIFVALKGKLPPPKLLKPGDQVTLTKGPSANFVAEVEKIEPDRRIWILMVLMEGQTCVAIAAHQLRTL